MWVVLFQVHRLLLCAQRGAIGLTIAQRCALSLVCIRNLTNSLPWLGNWTVYSGLETGQSALAWKLDCLFWLGNWTVYSGLETGRSILAWKLDSLLWLGNWTVYSGLETGLSALAWKLDCLFWLGNWTVYPGLETGLALWSCLLGWETEVTALSSHSGVLWTQTLWTPLVGAQDYQRFSF